MPADPPPPLSEVPGWFTATDQLIFEWILDWQRRTGIRGDLVELGVYQGKSAIHMARFLAPGEKLTVCDLFDGARSESTIRADARHAYRDLSQEQFESNFLRFHDTLPVVVRGLTSVILHHVEPASCRMVHVDASHMYEHVRADAAAARVMLNPAGVVVFDDYRTEHTLGTAAAVWETLITDDLRPVCASAMKLYATWGDPEPIRQELFERIAERVDHRVDSYDIFNGERLVRVVAVPSPAAKTSAGKKPPAKKPAPAAPTPSQKVSTPVGSPKKKSLWSKALQRGKRAARATFSWIRGSA